MQIPMKCLVPVTNIINWSHICSFTSVTTVVSLSLGVMAHIWLVANETKSSSALLCLGYAACGWVMSSLLRSMKSAKDASDMALAGDIRMKF